MADLPLFIFTILSSSIGLVVSIILFFGQDIATLSSKILSAILFCLVILTVGNSLTLSTILYDYPQFFKTYTWAAFCIGPLFYLYVRTVLNQSYKLYWKDSFMFIPALLYQVHRLPFDILSRAEKLVIVKRALSNRIEFIQEAEGLLPPGWLPIIRILVLLISMFAALILLLRRRKKIFESKIQIERNKQIYRFLWVSMGLIFIGTLLVAIITFLQFIKGIFLAKMIVFVISCEILFICIYLFTQPKILYGMIGWIQMDEPVKSLQNTTFTTDQKSVENDDITYVSHYHGISILNSIETHFRENHPFTTIGYCLADLSREINVPAYLVSTVINQEFDKNFNEFVNDARFEYLKIMRLTDQNFDKYSIEYIGNSLGFGSRTSFISAVKKRTGLLPKEYLANI
ncbi:helix-turn-helix domain-containing protein [Aquirufa rosea]|uniref:Helix-turn-helix domain-containing protein n=1 Tax=Aquirufa rosea TaxID=2509241 RepID=A0A4Q1BZ64_9BACT|nr:helix-turn-helix domain-containing protein [Aquirufa rosea]RXK48817.1 helix-turn-helix domain-containing protein [Aquirufa rosea]